MIFRKLLCCEVEQLFTATKNRCRSKAKNLGQMSICSIEQYDLLRVYVRRIHYTDMSNSADFRYTSSAGSVTQACPTPVTQALYLPVVRVIITSNVNISKKHICVIYMSLILTSVRAYLLAYADVVRDF